MLYLPFLRRLHPYEDSLTRGYRDIQIRTTEWHAPGIGLVKLVREEPLDTDVFQGKTEWCGKPHPTRSPAAGVRTAAGCPELAG